MPRRRTPLVMMYHSVRTDAAGSTSRTATTPADLDAQLAVLAEHYRVVPLDEFADALASRARMDGLAAISFDDAYADTLEVAGPMLERHRLPATVFVPTAYPGRASFWWDALQAVFAGAPPPRAEWDALAAGFPTLSMPAQENDDMWRAAAWDRLRRLLPDAADAAVAELAARLGRTLPPLPRPIGWEDVPRLAAWPFDLGAHAVTHRPLTALLAEEAAAEIAESRRVLEQASGRAVPLFSYPFGLFDMTVAARCRAEGFGAAVAVMDEAAPSAPGTDAFAIPRLNGGELDAAGLSARLDALEAAAPLPRGPAAYPLPPPEVPRTLDFRRPTPVRGGWGYTAGQPLDRPFIEAFLSRNARDIRGRVLEIKSAEYAGRFGQGVTAVDILDIDPGNADATIVDDLQTGAALADSAYDCVILTQVLQLVPDCPAALRTVRRVLRPGGVLLVASPGISQSGTPEDGQFHWAFYRAGLQRLLEEAFGTGHAVVEGFGNAGLAASFLMGLTVGEVPASLLREHDPDYAIVLTGRAFR